MIGFLLLFSIFFIHHNCGVASEGAASSAGRGSWSIPWGVHLFFHGICVGWVYLFYYLRLFFFFHGWFGLHVILHLHLQCVEGGQNRWKKEIDWGFNGDCFYLILHILFYFSLFFFSFFHIVFVVSIFVYFALVALFYLTISYLISYSFFKLVFQ